MKKIIFPFLFAMSACAPSQAQQFDAQKGYIYDQPFATRISNADASQLTGIQYVDADFLLLFQKQGKDGAVLPAGVRRTDDALIFQVQDIPELRLKDHIYTDDNHPGDSQQFFYLKELRQYHVAVVTFRFSRPCFLLIRKSDLKVFFINYYP